MSDRSETRPSSRWPLALMLLLVAAAWVPLYLQRRSAHEPNVDDYLYTLLSMQLAHAGSFVDWMHTLLHSGQTAPLVLLLAAPGALHGVDGAVAVELPLLLLLAGGAWMLARRWVGPWEAALIGFAAAANQAVLGWSLMVHFSVVASAMCLWSLAAYLWSEGFQRWGWSIVTGASVGLLLLSRSIAPIYAVPLVIVFAVDSLLRRRLRWTQAGAAIVIVLLIAGPWWLVSGETAFHYLRNVGYDPSHGGTTSSAHLSLHSIVLRIRWTLGELGPFQALILVAAPITAVLHRRRMPGSAVGVAWIALTLIGLATSSNVGTGFGLPLVAVAIALGGAVVFTRSDPEVTTESTPDREPSWRRRGLVLAGIVVSAIVVLVLLVGAIDTNAGPDLSWPVIAVLVVVTGALMTFRSVAAVVIVVVIAVGFAAEWSGGLSPSWFGPPYRRMALEATRGAPAPNIDAIHREVARAIAGRPTLFVRDDDLLNVNGLVYTAETEHLTQHLVPAPYGDAQGGVHALANAQLLIAGIAPAPYHDYANTVETAAMQDGWTKIRSWSLACGNTVDLWSKTARQSANHRQNRSPYETAVLADSPEMYWRLGDKTCTAEDASGGETTGIYAGHPKLGAPSLIADRNPSVHLDGKDDEIAFTPSRSPAPMKAISVEAWLRPDQIPTSAGSAWQLVTKWNTALLFLNGGPRPKFVFALADAADTLYKPRVTGTVTVKPETVYHVVGTYDDSKIRIYVNGTLAGAVSYTKGLLDPNYGGALAYRGWGTLPTPHFQGSLDEVAIYGHALSPGRIEAHYRVGTGAAGH